MVGYTLVSGASFGRDFVCRLIGSDKETSWTRIGLFVAGVLAVVVGLNVGSVVALWYSWAGAIVGALMIPTCLAFFSTRTPRAWVTTTAMTAGFAVGLWLMIWGQLNENPYLQFTAPAQAFGYNLPDGLANQGFSLGTLLPGLVISGLVMLIGRAIGASDERRND
jgi:SSS family solute:Na+ symporter